MQLAGITTCVSLAVAAFLPTTVAASLQTAGLPRASAVGHQASIKPASVYIKSVTRVSKLKQFTIKETFHFLAPQSDRGRFEVRYSSTGKLWSSWWLIQSKPPSSMGPNVSQVRTSRSDVRNIVSNLMLPQAWIHNDGRPSHQIFKLMASGLRNFRISGRTATTGASPAVKVDVLKITALGYPWGCGPSSGCSGAADQYWTNNNSYTGILIVDAKTGLPRSYSSTVRRFHQVYAGQKVTFSYGRA
jgi:hypothetical protein